MLPNYGFWHPLKWNWPILNVEKDPSNLTLLLSTSYFIKGSGLHSNIKWMWQIPILESPHWMCMTIFRMEGPNWNNVITFIVCGVSNTCYLMGIFTSTQWFFRREYILLFYYVPKAYSISDFDYAPYTHNFGQKFLV